MSNVWIKYFVTGCNGVIEISLSFVLHAVGMFINGTYMVYKRNDYGL